MTDESGSKDNPKTPPSDPITQMMEGMAQMHEIFKTMTDSGFTEWQACRIIGVMLAEGGRQS